MFSYTKYSLLSICSWDWTCNFQMVTLRRTVEPNVNIRCTMCAAKQSEFLGLINLMSTLTNEMLLTTMMNDMDSHGRLFDFTSTYCLSIFLKPNFYWAACLAFVYFTTTAWNGIYAILCYVLLLTRKRYFWKVVPLLNIVQISYGLHVFWIFSARPLTLGRQTGESSGIVLCRLIQMFWGQYYTL